MNSDRPSLLVNSLPKSGTHILTRAAEVCGFGEHFEQEDALDPRRDPPAFLSYRRVLDTLAAQGSGPARPGEASISIGTQTPVPVPVDDMRRWLAAIRPGQYIISHIAHSPELAGVLEALGMKHLFIIRDPRAVLNSLLDFVLTVGGSGRGQHFLQADFEAMTLEQRVDLILHGGHAPRADVQVRAFREIYRDMLAWRDDPGCLVVTYEELVGPAGGGRLDWQRAALARVVRHLGLPADAELLDRSESLYSRTTRTFRRGRVGGWQSGLSPAAVDRITDGCRDLQAMFDGLLERRAGVAPPSD